jgi:uncharacterized membrane protein
LKAAVVALGCLVLLAGCGFQRSDSDRTRDAELIANAMRAADDGGQNFTMDETLLVRGGDIPSGQASQFKGTATGAVRAGRARWSYKIQQQQGSLNFEMLLGHGQLFVRPSGTTAWRTTAAAGLAPLYPSIRLDLLAETVLLAKNVSGWTLSHVSQGFAHRYVVTPANDQLEQLEGVPVPAALEPTFLKSARLEIDVFLSAPGDRLFRIEVHMSGTDPDSREVQQIDSLASFNGGKVPAVALPAAAQPVQPSDILSTS